MESKVYKALGALKNVGRISYFAPIHLPDQSFTVLEFERVKDSDSDRVHIKRPFGVDPWTFFEARDKAKWYGITIALEDYDAETGAYVVDYKE